VSENIRKKGLKKVGKENLMGLERKRRKAMGTWRKGITI
jgi:hypothetical protein